ncbi:hypothetical protein [Micromonospora sp. WMMD987]|uniref:hypothetical protein n=1 Tax=Micromonospora sp. WMMD987 TaxID=3016089 RepID=UPI002499F9B3|nr:hypothetical protein [Micromonospora sp. WMMD987]WFE94776.1 hypothetical protein O7612_26180 [Micromonospora sp. WMMD987]
MDPAGQGSPPAAGWTGMDPAGQGGPPAAGWTGMSPTMPGGSPGQGWPPPGYPPPFAHPGYPRRSSTGAGQVVGIVVAVVLVLVLGFCACACGGGTLLGQLVPESTTGDDHDDPAPSWPPTPYRPATPVAAPTSAPDGHPVRWVPTGDR